MKPNIRLRVLRAERGLTQMDTAAKAKIALYRYWQIENGYKTANDDERLALAKVFKVEEADAFPAAQSA